MLPRAVALAALLALSLFLAQAAAPRTPATPTAPTASLISPFVSPAALGTAAAQARPASPVPIPDGFRVRIARLHIDLPIAEGVIERDIERQRTPEGFAFHLPGTAIPGKRGNAYLYSHARVGMFLSLWDARVGDEIVIATADGRTMTYVVSEVRPRVAPTDVSVAEPTDDERLTLQTSTGPDPGDPRFIVIALPRP